MRTLLASLQCIAREVRKLKNGKATGYSDILPEMVKAGARSEDFMCMMSAVWEDKCVPQEWADAILVPISPRKETCTAVTIGGI